MVWIQVSHFGLIFINAVGCCDKGNAEEAAPKSSGF
jgi:hypothetical protein